MAELVVPEAHSILPLAVLEAMRNLDTPSDEEVAEYVDELLRKRLGLSDTVTVQIRRYERAARRDRKLSGQEVEQVFRLAGRRPDAPLVFSDGGRRAARRAVRRLGLLTRGAARYGPRPLRRAVGFAGAARTALAVFGARLGRPSEGSGGGLVGRVDFEISSPLAVLATPDGSACGFFAAAFAELLRELVEFDDRLTHGECLARGGACCRWETPDGGTRWG